MTSDPCSVRRHSNSPFRWRVTSVAVAPTAQRDLTVQFSTSPTWHMVDDRVQADSNTAALNIQFEVSQ